MPRLRLRSLAALVTASAVALGTGVALGAPAQAASSSDGYYQASWSPTIYRFTDNDFTPLTYAQWTAAGSPAPQQMTVTYSRFPWDPTIYRDTRVDEFFLQYQHQETGAEWAAAGRPAPGTPDPDSANAYRWGTSDELFAKPADGKVHKLTSAEWDAINNPGPDENDARLNQGFEKLTWSGDIAFGANLDAGGGAPITYARWAAEAFPTPRQAVRFYGDQFYRHAGSSTIYYAGPTMNRAITYAEWTAAGRPTPTVK